MSEKHEQKQALSSEPLQEIIDKVLKLYDGSDYIQAGVLPDLDLYVDQITTFLTQRLDKTKRCAEDKIMTKTMINNYTKNHLLPPPEKKKYSKDHILLLILIYYFKSFLSISDIQTLLDPLTSEYFHSNGDYDLSSVYTALFECEKNASEQIRNSIDLEYQKAMTMFDDVDDSQRIYLQKLAFICLMSHDIFIKKQLIEEIIDQKI